MSTQNINRIYFAFLALLPLVFVPKYVVDPALVPRQLALCVFVWLLLGIVFFSKIKFQTTFLKTTPFRIMTLFLGVIIISGFNSEMNSESLYVISKWLIVALFFVLTTLLIYHKIIIRETLIQGVVVFASIALLAGYWDVVLILEGDVPLMKKIRFIKSLFANKNLFSSVLFLCFPFLWMALDNKNIGRKFALLILILAVPLLILTQTRTVWLAIAVFAAVFFSIKYKKSYKAIGAIALFFTSAIILFCQYLAPLFRTKKPEGAVESFLFRLGNLKTISARTDYWNNAWQMFTEHPWLGVGPGNFGKYFPKYGFVDNDVRLMNGTETLQRVHNDFLTVLCETGILGWLPYMAIWGFVITRLLHLIKNAESWHQQRDNAIILAAILGFAVISFFDFPMERIEHQVLFFILVAWVVAHDALIGKKTPSAVGYLYLKPLLVTTALFASWVTLLRMQGELNTVKMYQAKAQQDWSNVVYFGQKALSKCYQIDPQSIPIDWYLGIAYFSSGAVEQSTVHFEHAYQLAPYQIQVIHNLGTVYEQNNKLDQAIDYYKQALRISPKFEDGLLSLAGCYYKKEQFDMAFKTIDQVNVASRNERYKKYLVKILVKEMNQILVKINRPDLAAHLAQKIKTSQDIIQFYWVAKKTNLNLEDYLKSYSF